jgi:ATP-binding cassette, subfamily B, bacterial
VRTAAGGWTLVWGMLLLVEGLFPVATVTLTRALVNRLIDALRAPDGWQTLRSAFPVVAGFALVVLLWELVAVAARWVRMVQSELIEDHVADLIHRRSVEVDLAFYDSPQFYDHLHRARDDSGARSVALLETLGGLVQNAITLVAMLVVLIPFGPWLPLALVVTTLPALYVVANHASLEHRWWLANTETVRRGWYYDWLLVSDVTAMEMRLFGLGDHFRSHYQELRAHLRDTRKRLLRDRTVAEARAGIAAVTMGGLAGLWMFWKTIQGLLTLGDLALAYQAFQQGQGMARTLLSHLGQLYTNVLYLGSLFEFLSLEPRVRDCAEPRSLEAPLRQGIRFQGVAFRYPRGDRDALVDVDFVAPAGKIAAVVGPNGSGKSTILKLLCRFYDPDAGKITIDGVDLKSIRLEDYRRNLAVVLQQPVRFNATAGENIAYGDVRRSGDDERVHAAASAAGAAEIIGRLSNGYDTPLGNWFDGGNELSVGEWQRVALARALYRQGSVLLLDEPTSAMDSWAEAEWLSRLPSLAAGRTTLLVTHRFAVAMRADVIHVVVDGRIVESGSHEMLVARGGLYARSWAAQTAA